MTLKTSGLGLIVLGILLLGAQLVLYLGFKNVHPPPGTGEQHIEPPPSARTTPLPGVFGAISLSPELPWSQKGRRTQTTRGMG